MIPTATSRQNEMATRLFASLIAMLLLLSAVWQHGVSISAPVASGTAAIHYAALADNAVLPTIEHNERKRFFASNATSGDWPDATQTVSPSRPAAFGSSATLARLDEPRFPYLGERPFAPRAPPAFS